MTKLELIELIALATIAIGIGIYYLIKALKNGWLKQLQETIETAIAQAEATGKTGDQKKALVLEAVREKCLELGIPYDFMSKVISRLIDKIVAHYNVIKKGGKRQ